MSHVFKIAVLLPSGGGGDHLVWIQWVERQKNILTHSMPQRKLMGTVGADGLWEAYGITSVNGVLGREFDEVVIAHPHVGHELIQAARCQLR